MTDKIHELKHMFYRVIKRKRDEWLHSEVCTIHELLSYIIQKGMMRDAQLDAIKTYLFLKIACGNQPLWKLFVDGTFNSLDLSEMPLTVDARNVLTTNKAAVALLEYALQKDKNGRQLAPALEVFIKEHATEIDYQETFKKIFYEADYTDYLFSLPMGAGKTYLMAAFIYLDLYFAQNEPNNPCFAHNFMIFAPSGLKSSIIPSLKHIKEFDPSWVIPEPTASQLKRLIKFEILDEQKSAKKSNLIKNPNAQKINNHQPLEDLIGLVAITNAEKVILDRIDQKEDPNLFSEEEKNKMKLANELRNIIGQLPNLAIYIDEVHHAADGDIKLRKVVNEWTRAHSFNAVLGFSGTPYLEKAEDVTLGGTFNIKNTDLANVVYYYPLIEGIGNFLKIPDVKYADNETGMIVRNGVKEFLEKYRETVYPNETCAKLAIYCGQIETLEEQIYPLAAEIATAYQLDPATSILKYHGGNSKYPQPEGSEAEFLSLDTPFSKIRIILLVQIGKEGWDCKSLTGVILPQKGVCPTNMVLQTSCRCLRQVQKNNEETALIWLNKFNADTLNRQLKQQQNITLQEFNDKKTFSFKFIERFSRMERMQVPPIDFFQLKVSYQTLTVDEDIDTAERLKDESVLCPSNLSIIHQQDMAGHILGHYEEEQTDHEAASFNHWLQLIAKESFGTLTVPQLKAYTGELQNIFSRITQEKDGTRLFSHHFDHQQIRAQIRRAFSPRREFHSHEETVPTKAALLQIEKLTSPIEVTDDSRFYPTPQAVKQIMDCDNRPADAPQTPEVLAALKVLEAQGMDTSALQSKDPHPEREKTYHYLPYRFDSMLEMKYFSQSILPIIKDKKLEVYFNGDDTLTGFKIDCYKQTGKEWRYIGKYVPDFLLISRNADRQIHKIIIIETKGEGFAAKFAEKRCFIETEFIKQNNEKFGYRRFNFLYLKDTLSREEQEKRTITAINQFFND